MKGKMLSGSRYKVKCGATLTIIEDLGWDNVTVIFDSGYTTKTQRSSILRGCVKDKLFSSVCGVGYHGVGEYDSSRQLPSFQGFRDIDDIGV